MNEIMYPTKSGKTLAKALLAAIIIAVIVFVTIILPSEYDIDPTGVGGALGLTVLAQHEEPVEVEAALEVEVTEAHTDPQSDTVEIVVPAGRGVEYKFKMEQFADIQYEWKTNGPALYFDFHGEPEGDTTGYFKSFTIATSSEMSGSMTVPFAGSHGWYWKNTTAEDVVVTLKTEGHYEVTGFPHK